MGVWGTESSSNDSTMDILSECCEDHYNPTQKEANKCLLKYFDEIIGQKPAFTIGVGLVIWFLQHNLSVYKKYLVASLIILENELKGKNERGWKDFKKRIESVKIEKLIIQSALNSKDHKATKEYSKGLGDVLSSSFKLSDFSRKNTIQNKKPKKKTNKKPNKKINKTPNKKKK